MKLSMQKTLTMGFKLAMTDALRQSLSASLEMNPAEMANYLNPSEADYVRIPVRALSATEVQGNCINFGHDGGKALMEAVTMFEGLTVLKDHIFSVDNWIGHTEKPYWDSQTADVPPGVNVMLAVDTKADPKTARGLISGDLNSVSVTIAFEYEKSHPKMSDMDFYMRMGEVVDGRTVQALVTKVTRLYEISVVWQGADKFAKTIGDDGTIDVPGTASNSETLPTGSKEETVDPKKLAQLLGLTLENPTEESITTALKAQGTTLAQAQADLTAAQTKLTAAEGQVTQLTADVAAKTTEVTTLDSKVKELEPKATLGDTFLTEQRNEALRLYNLCEGDKATEAMRKLISESTLEVAKSFIGSYSAQADKIAPLTCGKCGHTQLSRRTSKQSDVDDPTEASIEKGKAERLKATVASIHS